MRTFYGLRTVLLLLSFFGTLYAAEVDCDKFLKTYSSHKSEREIFVIIDKSTPLPEVMQKNALINILALIKPETMVDIFTLSEHNKDGYLAFSGGYYFDSKLSEKDKNDFSSKAIQIYNQCLDVADAKTRASLTADFYDAMQSRAAEYNITRSDLLYGLKNIAASAVAASPAQQKIVFILSDMLENSSYLSFYTFGQLASMGVGEALYVVSLNDLFADFGGTDVFVVGAGYSPYQPIIRNVRDKDALETFWSAYFRASNANLRRFEEGSGYPVKNIYE